MSPTFRSVEPALLLGMRALKIETKSRSCPTNLMVMSVDVRTRSVKDVRSLERDEMLDALLPDALAVHGDLAGTGMLVPADSRRWASTWMDGPSR